MTRPLKHDPKLIDIYVHENMIELGHASIANAESHMRSLPISFKRLGYASGIPHKFYDDPEHAVDDYLTWAEKNNDVRVFRIGHLISWNKYTVFIASDKRRRFNLDAQVQQQRLL